MLDIFFNEINKNVKNENPRKKSLLLKKKSPSRTQEPWMHWVGIAKTQHGDRTDLTHKKRNLKKKN